jgi:hypothetical protein
VIAVAKLIRRDFTWGTTYVFHCPGCGRRHVFEVRTDGLSPSWQFNGDMDRPTFTPSLLYPHDVCHLFLTDGVIHYHGDCTHRLAGRSVPLPEIE